MASQALSVSLSNGDSRLCSPRCWWLLQGQIGHSSNASSEGGHLPSRSGEKQSACFDVTFSAAAALALSRRCRVSGALIDELLLYRRARSLLETNLRAEPCEKLYATGASPDGAGGCAASITQDHWLALYDWAEEKEKHVRLDWKGEVPPGNMHDGRVAAAPFAMKLNWTTMFSYRFSKGKHINLEPESLISLLRRITREGVRARRLLVLVETRVASGAVSKGR